MELRKTLKGEFKIVNCDFSRCVINLGDVELNRQDIFITPEDGEFKILSWGRYAIELLNEQDTLLVGNINKDNFHIILNFCSSGNVNAIKIYKRDEPIIRKLKHEDISTELNQTKIRNQFGATIFLMRDKWVIYATLVFGDEVCCFEGSIKSINKALKSLGFDYEIVGD